MRKEQKEKWLFSFGVGLLDSFQAYRVQLQAMYSHRRSPPLLISRPFITLHIVLSRYHRSSASLSHLTCLVASESDPTITDPFATITVIGHYILFSPKESRS